MEIRFAHAGDLEALLELLTQVCQVHHEIRPDIFRSGTRKYEKNDLLELLKAPKKPIFVAAEAGKVLGYCFCQLRSCDGGVFTTRRELYIDDLCVREGHRGKGIAKALYAHVQGYARDLGCNFITLNVWCGNDNAMKFYEKLGLRPRNIMMETEL